MASVHCRQHVESFSTTTFSDDDAVGPHAQRISYKVTNFYSAFTFCIGRPGFQRDKMFVTQLQFRCILDRDQALPFWNAVRKNIEEGRFAGPCPPRHEYALTRFHTDAEKLRHVSIKTTRRKKVGHGKAALRKLADGQARTAQGNGRNYCIYSRSILEPGVHHGRRLVHASSKRRNDTINDSANGLIATETAWETVQLARLLDKYLIMGVHHDFTY